MSYREDRDALRGRVEDLEQELADAREKAERGDDGSREQRIAELEAQMAEGRRLLDRMGVELDALRGRPRQRGVVLVVAGAALFLGAGFAFALVRSVGSAPPPPVLPPALGLPPPPPEPVKLAPPKETATATAAPVPPAPRSVTARWKAIVKRATGRAIAPGSSCVVEAALLERSSSKESDIQVDRLTVACGSATLYDSSAQLTGMSMYGAGAEEDAGERDGTFRYSLQYEDKGARTGPRTEASIDSFKGVGAAWSDTMPSFRVEFTLPYQSDPVTGGGLLEGAREVLRREAVVVGREGAAPLAIGARCELRATPRPKGVDCLTRLVCGREVVYGKGTTGLAACSVADGHVVHVSDTEPTGKGGDPEIDVDTAAGTMKLGDQVGAAHWSASFKLEDPR